ncbi:MAG: methyltransferase domain-containing protein [Pirellulales bacterium]|nr:methyltransferase domain-containing protein [Pirellulales bacterium]
MPESGNRANIKHHHKGKSSESILDKEEILEALDIRPGQTILDAGCGDGYMAKEFARLTGPTGKVYALDPDDDSIDTLAKETQGTPIEAFVGDITRQTRLEPSSIDLIYLSTVIHGFSANQMEGFVAEVERLLSENGRLAILEVKKEETPYGPPLEIRFSAEELKQQIPLEPAELVDISQYFYLQIFNNPA